MKLAVLCAALLGSATAVPFVARQNQATPEQIAALAPDLGAFPNTNPNQFGDCDGPAQADGKIPRVPCACPPLRDDYIRSLTANVQAGFAVNNTGVRVTFPVGDSVDDKHGRITAAIITLQNLRGPGVGCPGVSTTLGIQSKNLDTCGDFQCGGGNTPAPSTTTPAAEPSSSSTSAAASTETGALTRELVDQLAPQLGGVKNNNPTGTGDCDGPPQPDGKIIKVPCACPPDRGEFIDQLLANIQAGHAVRNPSVTLSFPTGDSVADKKARITASTITLQNLNGPGQGCPNVSTTLAAQSKALDQCGEFVCGSDNQGNGNSTLAPSPTVAATSNSGPRSTTTVTSITVVTSTVTVTRGNNGNSDTATATATTTTSAAETPTATPPAAGSGNGSVLTRDIVEQLAPELGSQPNNNPNQFGDCDGPAQPDGKIARVPCACPPTRDEFITQLLANAQAGHALKNPTVALSFPLGDSKEDRKARITAGTITLQNLNGPGQGCPNVSTTFAAQALAIDNE